MTWSCNCLWDLEVTSQNTIKVTSIIYSSGILLSTTLLFQTHIKIFRTLSMRGHKYPRESLRALTTTRGSPIFISAPVFTSCWGQVGFYMLWLLSVLPPELKSISDLIIRVLPLDDCPAPLAAAGVRYLTLSQQGSANTYTSGCWRPPQPVDLAGRSQTSPWGLRSCIPGCWCPWSGWRTPMRW